MKKYFIYIILISLFCCSKRHNIEPILISVEPSNNMSFFGYKDERYLKTYRSDKKLLDEVKLKDNVDSFAKAFLFKPNDNYILIDCNGIWYYIDYKTGNISKNSDYDPWIKKKLPANYIGTFMQQKTRNTYFLKKEEKIDKKEVYKYGGGNL